MFGLPNSAMCRAAFAKYQAARAALPANASRDPLLTLQDQLIQDFYAAFPVSGKLGKKAVRVDKRTLNLAKYTAALPAPPDSVTNSRGFTGDWGMLLNGPNADPRFPDGLGNCTCAGVAHASQAWVLSQIAPGVRTGIIMPSEGAVLDIYERWCNFNPADLSTDQGGVMLDILNLWRQQGFMGRKIEAYAAVNAQVPMEVKQTINLFGCAYIGVQLPASTQGQKVWDVVSDDGGIEGGHCIVLVDYDADGLTALTWGSLQRLTWAWLAQYCDEMYGIVADDWHSPAGFDAATLQQDLTSVTA